MTGDPKAEEITKKQFIAWYEAIFPAPPPPEEPEEEEAEGLAAVGASCFSCVRKSRARLEAKYADAKAFAEKQAGGGEVSFEAAGGGGGSGEEHAQEVEGNFVQYAPEINLWCAMAPGHIVLAGAHATMICVRSATLSWCGGAVATSWDGTLHFRICAPGVTARIGLGRTVALYCRSSTSYRICQHSRYLYF